MKPLILDSALGTELENRGEYLPSFKTSIWSAYSFGLRSGLNVTCIGG